MGLLVEGQWQDSWYDTEGNEGKFVRQDSLFRRSISAQENAEFPAAKDRYHLYVSLACPWAHRTLIFRKLKQLESYISVSVVSPDMLDKGWVFDASFPQASKDHLYDFNYMHQLYTKMKSDITSRVTVPVLWDKQSQQIINNESADIIRMFNSAFDHLTGDTQDFYPTALGTEIDEINAYIYDKVNNGVYKAGFATTQAAYEEAVSELFKALDYLEAHLSKNRYLVANQITEADWRLFTTLVRFDPVYVGHFKCNLKRIEDYPALSHYLRELYQVEGIAETVNFEHIKRHYYYSHDMINPTRVVPKGPTLDLSTPHNRGDL